ncbi:Hypothetical protein SFBmNL_00532 [Candidatus Arthromitus sp. SFB-mouse-NL]|uniref:hypothetical protein n=1 Tax=Candidatus Arthromitus sp. SFB-mouse-NL TaxID=1508644 RepID=UPI00049A0AAA|nr:hypothetical protein [Candidatus Arthromitus sp. SFB-mouse-NL]AID44440.1 Hypothetical protein SFBmNL_00532 [Candidatus Arthromitus sp. SFB-mouse-NL]
MKKLLLATSLVSSMIISTYLSSSSMIRIPLDKNKDIHAYVPLPNTHNTMVLNAYAQRVNQQTIQSNYPNKKNKVNSSINTKN